MDKQSIFNGIEYRNEGESRLVEGCAVKFNSDSEYMGFTERILPEAITPEVIEKSDVFVYLNHDDNRGVLARSKYGVGSLRLELREDGLYYAFEAPHTQLGDELLEYLKRGDITQSSFAFTVAEGGDKWYRDADGKLRRDISKIDRLFDCSPVFQPAYAATTCAKRKLEEFKELEEKYNKLKEEIANW